MTEIAVADIGGTNARFALARIEAGEVVDLGAPVTLRTADYASLARAWRAFGKAVGRPLPRAAGIAIAAPVGGEVLQLTNSPWIIRPAALAAELELDRVALVNDFGAVAHAVSRIGPEYLRHCTGPDTPIDDARVVSVVGPGTGLGVGMVVRTQAGPEVVETEGGHVDFAPLDAVEDNILHYLRPRLRRVSAERIAAGPGLVNLYEALAAAEGRPMPTRDTVALWTAAIDGTDDLARTALDRFCLSLGAIAGDVALVQGAQAVVIAGGLGLRLADILPKSGFGARFVAKGRFETRMRGVPVKIITHPEPGLLGAGIALARETDHAGQR